jgi:DNA polymerase-3 subunit beta
MDLTLDRAPALAALSRVAGVVERRHTIPILSNVALSAADGRLSLRATDLDMEAVESISAEVGVDGDITLPADKLHDIVRSSDAGAQIHLALDDADPRVKVKSGRSNFRVPALPFGDFPRFACDGLGAEFALDARVFASMLARTKWAIETRDRLSLFNSVYLATTETELHAVGASHSAVALARIAKPEGAAIAALLPPKLVDQLIRWLGDADAEVRISSAAWVGAGYESYQTARLIRVRCGDAALTAKLCDAPKFVDYPRVLIERHDNAARTDQDALKAALRRALIMTDVKTHGVRLAFAEGGLTVQARNDHAGEGADEIGAEYGGPEASFLLAAHHLEGVLAHLKGDVVEIGFSGERVDGKARTITVVRQAPADPSFIVNRAQPRA